MKTGFIHGFPNKPIKKRYSYHGMERDCLIQPLPDPFEDFPIDVPYGPTQYIVFYNIFIDGYWYYDPDYNVCRNRSVGLSYIPYIGQDFYVPNSNYYIRRAMVAWNTAGLPTESKIVSGKCRFAVQRTSGYEDFDVVLRNGMPTFPHLFDCPADYNRGNYWGNGGSVYFRDRQIIDLNEMGLGWINKEGITKFALISSNDIAGTVPVGLGLIYYKGNYFNHTLEIGYKLPL